MPSVSNQARNNSKQMPQAESSQRGVPSPINNMGDGLVKFPNGDTFAGAFDDEGLLCGTGVYTFASGDVYDGPFVKVGTWCCPPSTALIVNRERRKVLMLPTHFRVATNLWATTKGTYDVARGS